MHWNWIAKLKFAENRIGIVISKCLNWPTLGSMNRSGMCILRQYLFEVWTTCTEDYFVKVSLNIIIRNKSNISKTFVIDKISQCLCWVRWKFFGNKRKICIFHFLRMYRFNNNYHIYNTLWYIMFFLNLNEIHWKLETIDNDEGRSAFRYSYSVRQNRTQNMLQSKVQRIVQELLTVVQCTIVP